MRFHSRTGPTGPFESNDTLRRIDIQGWRESRNVLSHSAAATAPTELNAPAWVERPTELAQLSRGPIEYRLERRGPRVVLIMHGGHVRASLALGEEVFSDARFTVLAPSRPGYGRTPLRTGTSPEGFAESVAELCDRLDIGSLDAVVGQSAGALSAVTMAARYPALVQRLILQSAVGPLPWPDRKTRLGARVVFGPRTERVTWSLLHALVRRAPTTGLRLMMRDLSVQPIGPVLAAMPAPDRTYAAALFQRMRSGSGFCTDLQSFADTAAYRRTAAAVGQEALVLASPNDGMVPFTHAQALVDALPNAHLIQSGASTHFIWFGDDYTVVTAAITRFLELSA